MPRHELAASTDSLSAEKETTMKTKMTAYGVTELTSQEASTASGGFGGVLTDPFRPLPNGGASPRLTRDGGGAASISRLRDRGVPLDTLCDLFSPTRTSSQQAEHRAREERLPSTFAASRHTDRDFRCWPEAVARRSPMESPVLVVQTIAIAPQAEDFATFPFTWTTRPDSGFSGPPATRCSSGRNRAHRRAMEEHN
ncbi:hypothetical protein ILFOPFJJ_06737 [Ensifer psoraleae]|nr:hypothetical protein [Sinorhizobium psoraleae]